MWMSLIDRPSKSTVWPSLTLTVAVIVYVVAVSHCTKTQKLQLIRRLIENSDEAANWSVVFPTADNETEPKITQTVYTNQPASTCSLNVNPRCTRKAPAALAQPLRRASVRRLRRVRWSPRPRSAARSSALWCRRRWCLSEERTAIRPALT